MNFVYFKKVNCCLRSSVQVWHPLAAHWRASGQLLSLETKRHTLRLLPTTTLFSATPHCSTRAAVRSNMLLSELCGWIYFLAWSASFYPQVHLNLKRRSVAGLSLDFVLLNVTGFTTYALCEFRRFIPALNFLQSQYIRAFHLPSR
jgi:uncharacterized protein with PQ loop repeat